MAPSEEVAAAAPAPFIVGVPRSGTTLLRLMLDAHSELAIPAETHFVPPLIRHMEELDAAGADDDELRRACVEEITSHPRFGDLGIGEDELRAHVAATQPFGVADAARAAHLTHARKQGKPRWGDKTPRYVRRMRPIQGTLEEARFLHVIRDGRDVAASLAEVSWGTTDPGEAAELWASGIRGGREHAEKLAPGTYLELRYEDLVSAPEAAARSAARFAGLDWDERMLAYHEGAAERLAPTIRDVRMPSGRLISAEYRRTQHGLAAEPPTPERAGRWRRDLSPEAAAAFEEAAGDLLVELGYEVE